MDFLEQRKGLPESGRARAEASAKEGGGTPCVQAHEQAPRRQVQSKDETTAPHGPAPRTNTHTGKPSQREAHGFAISFIRTVTVGSGIAPDLLTLRSKNFSAGARGLPQTFLFSPRIPPVGSFAPP